MVGGTGYHAAPRSDSNKWLGLLAHKYTQTFVAARVFDPAASMYIFARTHDLRSLQNRFKPKERYTCIRTRPEAASSTMFQPCGTSLKENNI
jgi:hypothetical protein